MSWIAGHRRALHLFDESDEAGETLFTGCLVGGRGIGCFACAHEAVACAIVGDGIVLFACGLHSFGGGGDGGADACIIACVKAVDGRSDGCYVRGARAVENEGRGEIFAMSSEGEGLSSTPAEARDGDLSVGCRNLFGIVGCGVEISVDYGCIEAGDGFGGGVHAGEGVGAAVVGAEAGEEIGCDDDEALSGELVGHLLGPVAEAEDLVDEDDDRGFGLDLGIDDEGLNGTVTVLEGYVLVMAGGGVETSFGPVLRVEWGCGEGEEQSDGE